MPRVVGRRERERECRLCVCSRVHGVGQSTVKRSRKIKWLTECTQRNVPAHGREGFRQAAWQHQPSLRGIRTLVNARDAGALRRVWIVERRHDYDFIQFSVLGGAGISASVPQVITQESKNNSLSKKFFEASPDIPAVQPSCHRRRQQKGCR